MAVTAAALDLSCFAYLALPQKLDGTPRLMSTYPKEWTSHYLRSHYERIDPVIMQALRDTEPFRWGIDRPNDIFRRHRSGCWTKPPNMAFG
jgi:hypothetical protein